MSAANLKRRLALLGGLSAAAALAAVPKAHAGASTIAETAAPMTAKERFNFHLAAMMGAATEINPLVRFSQKIDCLDNPERPLAFFCARPPTRRRAYWSSFA